MMAQIPILILLTVLARQDMEKREIDGALLLFFPVLGILRIIGERTGSAEMFRTLLCGSRLLQIWEESGSLSMDLSGLCAALIPGLLLLALSLLTKEEVGEGDALVFLGMAFVFPGGACIRLLFTTSCLAGGTAVWMLVRKHAGGKQAIPLIPLILAAVLCELGNDLQAIL